MGGGILVWLSLKLRCLQMSCFLFFLFSLPSFFLLYGYDRFKGRVLCLGTAIHVESKDFLVLFYGCAEKWL